MSAYKRIFLLSPVRDFHKRIASDEMSPRLYDVLKAQLEWAVSILEAKGMECRTTLELAPVKDVYTSAVLTKIFRTASWNRQFIEKGDEALHWCDCIALMPECQRVKSEDMLRILEKGKENYLPVMNVEELIGISSGDVRRSLDEIELSHLRAREHSKIIMRGGRDR